ncbi:MAG: hypothetical protein HN368_20785 [Spirochaetales bacterium]|nr:hypothetical protein [Spirochaetales bacterium]
MRSANSRAYVTFLILNDTFLPGALLQAHALGSQDPNADRICLITQEITKEARRSLELLFHFVVTVSPLYVSHIPTKRRQDLPWLLTKLNALRLGSDGDLGFSYTKIVLLDADILPLKHYQHLFLVDSPAGTINEKKDNFIDTDGRGRHRMPEFVNIRGQWRWHTVYRDVGHGYEIPRGITDRVKKDHSNMGVNTALMVLEPSIAEYARILEDLSNPEIAFLMDSFFKWPDMQYLTMKWSGKWHNIDACFCGINGYPSLYSLFGAHFAGIKPWDINRWKSVVHYSRYEDFKYWHGEYSRMIAANPTLLANRRLEKLMGYIDGISHPRAEPAESFR